ncbi:hypothetical protein COO60DRAFT_1553280 [Scenedesmus sp. NREL 46B-D3]|nr:hypothetical protein COO60DRAFT_1553280 [Scenedesmus sp. NREL 46B-D3]
MHLVAFCSLLLLLVPRCSSCEFAHQLAARSSTEKHAVSRDVNTTQQHSKATGAGCSQQVCKQCCCSIPSDLNTPKISRTRKHVNCRQLKQVPVTCAMQHPFPITIAAHSMRCNTPSSAQ